MTTVYVRDEQGKTLPYQAVEGWSLMEILKDYGLPLKAECGGACCCATCHVYVDYGWIEKLPPMNGEEEDMLDSAPDVQENSRLSCQIILDEKLDGLIVEIVREN